MDQTIETHVLVVGAGNAALCSAIAAAQQGAKVTVLEKAPQEYRGGNSAVATGHLRFAYEGVDDLMALINDVSPTEVQSLSDMRSKYTQAEFYDDLMTATDGKSDPDLANTLVSQAHPTVQWMRSLGHEWVPQAVTAPFLVGVNGGGLGLQERGFAIAERMGVQFAYDTRAMELLQDNQGRVSGVRALSSNGFVNYHAKAVVLACGGFEANAEMRARYLGPNWDTVKVQGVPFNTGDGLRMALEVGALPYGNWTGCQSPPQDLNTPPYQLPQYRRLGEEITDVGRPRYPYIFSIMVNIHGQRFIDEGERIGGFGSAKIGRAIVAQPGSVAFQLYDAKCREQGLVTGEEHASSRSDTLEGLAGEMGIDTGGLLSMVREFNQAVQPGEFDPLREAGPSTKGITPPKSNWALTIDKPPFEGFAVVPSITFTFGGLKIDDKARVLHTLDRPLPGLYTAGEMVGGLFHGSYLVSAGLMSGAVFGRKAGTNAADYALAM